ncbi:WRKY domain containing protein [Parasponia andersonii]|uniref:WRKY domain containing protein n=1 Tax=Parasponia andersonii TaxID=3476 RepID=A0A2P5E284_PARAD|nr:WRKY domain containing protein [Parasponia andersonii]
MDDDEKFKSDLGAGTEFGSESSWTHLGADSDDVDGVYFFSAGDRENSILSEFGWNFHQEDDDQPSRAAAEAEPLERSVDLAEGADFRSTEPETAAPIGSSASNNPSVSSSSSEDPPEKSTGSGGKPPPEIPNKVKKKGQKRMRQPRFAFMTKSEVDHLEDGYRWRKYGQKAVKNSPFPRSYYRCTNSKCTVKKRVERSSEDPTTVITTYEGQHCHHTVGFPRGGIIAHHEAAAFPGCHFPPPISKFYYPTIHSTMSTTTETSNNNSDHLLTNIMARSNQVVSSEAGDSGHVVVKESTSTTTSDLVLPVPDEGLLGDIVPPGMRSR